MILDIFLMATMIATGVNNTREKNYKTAMFAFFVAGMIFYKTASSL